MVAKRPTWVPVVAGFLRRENTVLCGIRPERQPARSQWEFPGGKLEANETLEEALKRELQEELGIDAQIGPLLLASNHLYGERGILLLLYEVLYWKGEPTQLHHSELKWVPIEELPQLDMLEANKAILPHLLEKLKA